MFDDLVNQEDPSVCPICGSNNVIFIVSNGKFIIGKRYRQTVKCVKCGHEWWVTLNEKLDIVEEGE